jgi:hypothetical protein
MAATRGSTPDTANYSPTGRAKGGVATRQGSAGELRVVGKMLSLVFGQIGFVIYRPDAANQFAGTAIHTFTGMDVERLAAFIDAVHWALLHTGLVHYVYTCSIT